MKKDKVVLMQLVEAVAKANGIKKEMMDQIETLKEKRKTFNIANSAIILSVDDIDCNGDSISTLNRKINLLENAVKTFRYSNYDFYKDAAKKYIDLIYKEVVGMEEKIRNSFDEAEKAIDEAEKHMEYLREVETPAIREEISQLLEPLGEDIYQYYWDISGTYVLDKLKRSIEE